MPQGSFRSSRQTTACQLLWTPSAFRFDAACCRSRSNSLRDSRGVRLGHIQNAYGRAAPTEGFGDSRADALARPSDQNGPTSVALMVCCFGHRALLAHEAVCVVRAEADALVMAADILELGEHVLVAERLAVGIDVGVAARDVE